MFSLGMSRASKESVPVTSHGCAELRKSLIVWDADREAFFRLARSG